MFRPFVTFSGIDCCGKSTQIELLANEWKQQGSRPVILWLRGGYTPGISAAKALVRRMMGKKAAPPGDSAQRRQFMQSGGKRRLWLYAAIADLFLQTAIRIRWHRLLGQPVICDRYLADTEIDFRMYFPADNVHRWTTWRLVKRLAARPDAAFLLDLSFEESRRRSIAKQEPFPEDDERRRERAGYYARMRDTGSAGWTVLDATRSVEHVQQQIRNLISPAGAAAGTSAGSSQR